ncbi:MAG TPA: M23 family metallopeptidase [Trichocoleus sp.]
MSKQCRDIPWHTHLALGFRRLLVLILLGWSIAGLSRYSNRVIAGNPPFPRISANPQSWQFASFPVENFTTYTSPFGYRAHPFGGYRFHYGLDMAAPMGSYVRNWWDGTVVEVSDDTACGTSAIIKSGEWLHIYCHMQGYIVVEVDGDRFLVDRDGGIELKQGSQIKAGARVGRVGMTGRTTGPHLHWGLKYKGAWVDPALVIKSMVEEQ